ncbi:ATP-binding cassette domain-containing protein [Gluconobacter cerinus]|uniref:ATP-binding cassette domain-containing protein n=1 Tax=Gluconobacter cerinus TaxID=38307 RepID=UPI001B8BF667|nr:ATP-binding cassette domain-containing protein [Gluconobacter cerinus]MBS1039267.1 ATP-binding cassette domain-containing protein [Gluconobacter cerinus]MBS1046558.1 ATP-binding cassette domain-containing protein [Gluconobacter cerinus]
MTLEIQNASAKAGGREIVHNLDLVLAAGEIVAVVGPNGAGKSTLLKLACGLMPLHGGEIRFDGSKIGSLSAGELSRRRALLPQECPMRARFTSLELVLMGTAISGQGRPMAERVAIAQDTLDRVGLSSFMERDIMTLSGGERQRVHLARVLAQLEAAAPNGAPGCLLLDEPLSAQDMARQRLILQIAKMHAAHGGSVLLVLHDLNWAAACADRIVVMHHGRIQSHGLPRDILTSELLHDVFGIPDGCIHQHCSTGRPFVVPHDLVMPEDINKRETPCILQ